MLRGQSEIRMIWLMSLMIVAISAWFLSFPLLTYVCGFALLMSVMHYVDAIQQPAQALGEQRLIAFRATSKVPLYLSSIIAVVGGLLDWGWMIAAGAAAWIFFFLRWLRRLEQYLGQIQQAQHFLPQPASSVQPDIPPLPFSATAEATPVPAPNLVQQIKHWIFEGNPVLKTAISILVIGMILLLRFATEHWQLSLATKLAMVALSSAAVTGLGYRLQQRNRSFALGLEGLGLAALCLTLFFAYYNAIIPNLLIASGYFLLLMALTLWLSLRQQSVELALMAMVMAYLAPFTLPVRDATAPEFIGYYLVINIAVAVLSSLRPWKFLNQIAFLMTVLVGGSYAFVYGSDADRDLMTVLILAHAAIFIWLGFRFSQLLAQQDLDKFKLKPALDIGLIFAAPLLAYSSLYVLHFQDTAWQAGLSLLFALLFAVLYRLSRNHQTVQLIAHSYLSLTLIFLAIIPPILLPAEKSVMGWAIEGLLIFLLGLVRQSKISLYLAMGLLVVAGLSSLYYLVELIVFPRAMFWVLCLSYVGVVLLSNSRLQFQQQLSSSMIGFQCLLMLLATTMLLVLLQDEWSGELSAVLSLFSLSLAYWVVNEILLRRQAGVAWLFSKWSGLVPLLLFAAGIVMLRMQQGSIVWASFNERLFFAGAGIILSLLWLRPLLGVRTEKEWVSAGTLLSLLLTSLTLLPQQPYISMVILPLLFCGWCYWQAQPDWQMFWQARSSLLLMLAWMICSQLLSQQAFHGYLLPILNPFDLVSIAMLVGFLWMLSLQVKAGLDRSMAAVLMVLSLLWLSSYIVLRGLHVYLGTPLNELALWRNGTVQLSLTLLWVSLAFVTMSWASRKQLRSVWVLGGSILVIVSLKLVLFDLSHIGTLTRVISFLAAGAVMLIIAYIAPMPDPEQPVERSPSE